MHSYDNSLVLMVHMEDTDSTSLLEKLVLDYVPTFEGYHLLCLSCFWVLCLLILGCTLLILGLLSAMLVPRLMN